jgi:hypothetical protein
MRVPGRAGALSLLLLLAAALAGCRSAVGLPELQQLQIAEVRSACHWPFPSECLLVWNEASQQWHYFGNYIEGFTHEWGTRYVLQVERRRVRNPPADGSDIAYRLRRVVSAEPSPLRTLIDSIRAAEQRWIAVRQPGPAWTYRMILERICDCPTSGRAEVRAVRHFTYPPEYGEHATDILAEATGQPLQHGFQQGYRTVWELFGFIYHAVVAANTVSFEFDEDLSYPRVFTIDPFPNTNGAAVTFQVHSLAID